MLGLHDALMGGLLITAVTILHGLPQTQSSPTSTLLPSPLISPQTQNLTEDPEFHCFNPEDRGVHPANEEQCALAIADIANRDGYDKYTQTRTFVTDKQKGPRRFKVPDQWRSGIPPDTCEVHIFGLDNAKDVFKLEDVAEKAQELVDGCLMGSKRQWGGVATVGQANKFFVGVNGWVFPTAPGGGEYNYSSWISSIASVQEISVD